MTHSYAQLYANKTGRTHYSFAFRVFNTLGERIAEANDDLPAKSKKEAKLVAKAIVEREMKTRGMSHISVFIDGVAMI